MLDGFAWSAGCSFLLSSCNSNSREDQVRIMGKMRNDIVLEFFFGGGGGGIELNLQL